MILGKWGHHFRIEVSQLKEIQLCVDLTKLRKWEKPSRDHLSAPIIETAPTSYPEHPVCQAMVIDKQLKYRNHITT